MLQCGMQFITECACILYIHTLHPHSAIHHFLGIKPCSMSMGRGKMMVEFFSAAMELRLCRYRSWSAEGDSAITREASFRAREAFISPSAVMIWNTDWRSLFVLSVDPHQRPQVKSPIILTFALASRLASASAAIARCSCWGNFTSLISTRSTLIPHGSVASSRDACKELFNTNLVPEWFN